MNVVRPADGAPEFFPRMFRPRLRRHVAPLDAVPFLNLILLLFLFHIASAPFVLQPGIRVDLPSTAFTDGLPYDSLVVTVSQEGMVFFNDRRTTMGGLRADFAKAAHGRDDVSLIIEADGRVSHATLVNIYNLAAQAGIHNVSLATRLAAEEPAP